MAFLNRNDRRRLQAENLKQPSVLRQIPEAEWPAHYDFTLREVWRSKHYLVQVIDEPNGFIRLSVCRTNHNGTGWCDAITWDELQRVKREVGLGERDALELFPADRDLVNVANFRHLWVTPQPVSFAWRK